MGRTQLTGRVGDRRRIDTATPPCRPAGECGDVVESCPPDSWYAGRPGTVR